MANKRCSNILFLGRFSRLHFLHTCTYPTLQLLQLHIHCYFTSAQDLKQVLVAGEPPDKPSSGDTGTSAILLSLSARPDSKDSKGECNAMCTRHNTAACFKSCNTLTL
ncbi:hypothetical protein EMCRGX_G027877 [Ephydatia muelleri]